MNCLLFGYVRKSYTKKARQAIILQSCILLSLKFQIERKDLQVLEKTKQQICFYVLHFRDTFANFEGWHKGVLFVNGFNVGRYWPTEGPQQTLYVPATILRGNCQDNQVVLLEQDRAPCLDRINTRACTIEFVKEPLINGPTPVH